MMQLKNLKKTSLFLGTDTAQRISSCQIVPLHNSDNGCVVVYAVSTKVGSTVSWWWLVCLDCDTNHKTWKCKIFLVWDPGGLVCLLKPEQLIIYDCPLCFFHIFHFFLLFFFFFFLQTWWVWWQYVADCLKKKLYSLNCAVTHCDAKE